MNPAAIRSLEERLGAIQDQFAIQQLISAYGPAADSCNLADIDATWTEDCVYDLGGIGAFHGHAGLRQVLGGDFHQRMVAGRSAQASTCPHVVLEGDRASATHHGTQYGHRDGHFTCVRLIASRWNVVRTAEAGWRIPRLTNFLVDGNAQARERLSRARVGGA